MTKRASALRVEPVGRDRWSGLCASFADHNYRQTWDMGLIAAERVGAVSEHVEIRDGARTVAIADVRVRRLPIAGGGIAYVNGGPLTRAGADWDVARYVAAAVALRDEYGRRRGCVLRLAPPIGPAAWCAELADALAAAGFRTSAAKPPYRTMLVPIDRPAAEIRKSLHQKWRNCLNRAERESLTVTRARDVATLERFGALFEEFVVRKGFDAGLGMDFYLGVQRAAPEHERFDVLTIESGGAMIAGHVSSTLGDTIVYLLGATAPDALTRKAAYLLQWRAIELGIERGCRWYDLGGIDPAANPGVHHFKEGLGGADVTAPGPVESEAGLRGRVALALEARLAAARARRAAAAQPAAAANAPAT